MMKARTFFAAAALVALTLLSVGCKKHSYMEGRTVRFKVTTMPVATKTAYSGEVVNGAERIDWIAAASGVQGDKVAIVMLNNDGGRATDYRVTGVSASSEKSIGTLTPVGEAFQWGEGNHDFYAIYPSPSVDASWSNNFFGWPGDFAGTLSLTYPKNQVVTADSDNLGVYLPDMKYAYMYAQIEDVAPVGTVNLSFSPIYTAFEISISAGENEAIDLRSFRLICNDEDAVLACDMSVDLENGLGFIESNTSNDVAVDFTKTGGPIRLTQAGGPIKFTVFTYLKLDADPRPKLSQLTLEFTGDQIGTRTLDLKQNGAWIEFDGGCKHNIYGLYFPKLDDATAGGQGINWGGMSGEDLGWHGAEGEDINWGGNRPLALPGEFSISATQKVNFSRGNLVYKGGEWDFHKMQYDRCFKDNGPVEIGPDATFDLFCWGTAGIAAADATMKYYQPWDYNDQVITGQEETNPYGFGPSITNVPKQASWTAYSAYCDWGNNYKLKEKLGSGWFTMTAYEWEHIFQHRNASTVNGVENARYSKATVHGLPVLLIFPDSFGDDFRAAGGDDTVFTSGNINNDSKTEADYSYTVLSQAVWAMAEAAGAVIIAPTGCLQLVEGVPFFGVKDDEGICRINAVWSSTANEKDSVSFMGCIGPELSNSEDGSWPRNIGIAVRLVKLAE